MQEEAASHVLGPLLYRSDPDEAETMVGRLYRDLERLARTALAPVPIEQRADRNDL